MGHHVVYATADMNDEEIISECSEGSLVLLSRDKNLCASYRKSMLIESVNLEEQIDQFCSSYKPDTGKMMMICPLCDSDLVETKRELVEETVPPAVYAGNKLFWRCPGCGKIYWKGTHYEKIMSRVSEHVG